MNTQLYKLPDWRQSLAKIGWKDAPTQASIDEAIHRELTKGYVTFKPQSQGMTIEAGCRVTLETTSALPKYNRENTVIIVGSNLYEAGIEGMLVGMTAGQSAQTQVKGETVLFTVVKVEQKVFPELSDKMVQAQQLEGISSLPQYCDYMQTTLKQAYAKQLCEVMLEKLIQGASMDEPDADDIRQVIDREFKPLRDRFSHGGGDLDTMSPEKWTESFYKPELKAYYEQIYPDIALLFDTTSKESFYKNRRGAAAQTIRRCLVLRCILQDHTDAHDPTRELKAETELMQAMMDRLCAIIYMKG
jgi:hypothetical protein